jgi:hypothetical protein
MAVGAQQDLDLWPMAAQGADQTAHKPAGFRVAPCDSRRAGSAPQFFIAKKFLVGERRKQEKTAIWAGLSAEDRRIFSRLRARISVNASPAWF